MALYTQKELEELAEYYDNTDLSEELDSDEAEYVETVVTDPMITMSLRMPKHVVDRVRAMAEERGVKPTQLMREWVEEQVVEDTDLEDAMVPASALYAFLAENARTHEPAEAPDQASTAKSGSKASKKGTTKKRSSTKGAAKKGSRTKKQTGTTTSTQS